MLAPPSLPTAEEIRRRATSTAATLLATAAPPDFRHLLPDVAVRSAWIHSDLSAVERRVTEVVDNAKHAERCAFQSLSSAAGQRHLVVGPPGAGKSHSAWVLARGLQGGANLPILIDVSTFDTADEVLRFVELPEGLSFRQLKELTSAVFILDGWSNFPSTAARNRIAERRKLLAAIGSARVITTGRRADEADHAFRIWRLEPLGSEWCARVLGGKTDRGHSANVLELVRQPLLLLLWAGAEGGGNSAGELLNSFQAVATRDVAARETLLQVVASACLRTQLKSTRRLKATFDEEIERAAGELALGEAAALVQQMGTLTAYGTVVRPFHDLYWAWLVGVGALQYDDDELRRTILALPLREAFQLVGESHRSPSSRQFATILDLDVTLASVLFISAPEGSRIPFEAQIRTLIRSEAAGHAYQGIKAALTTGCCVVDALVRIGELREAGHYWPNLEASVDVDLLWEVRDDVAAWFATNPKGADYILDAVQARGDDRWAEWCQKLAQQGVMGLDVAVATAASCTTALSGWARAALPEALENGAWKFRLAAARGRNKQLAIETLRVYEGSNDPKNSRWLHLNRIIVGCGDDDLFATLCDQYPTMSPDAQEALSYALDDLGDPWRTKVQQTLFRMGPDLETRGKIFEKISRKISPDDARRWARSADVGTATVGWRALAAALQNDVIPELVAALPDSLSGLHFVPTLIAIQELDAPPETLTAELWKRLRGTIEPRAMHDFILALACIQETGLSSLGHWLMRDPARLQSYHFSVFLRALFDWQRRTGKRLMVRYPDGDAFSLAITVFALRLRADSSDSFFDRICYAARGTNLAKHLRHEWAKGDDSLGRGVSLLGEMEEYDPTVMSGFLIRHEQSGSFNWALFLGVFAGSLGTFPEEVIARLPIESVNLEDLIRALARSPAPGHAHVHARVAKLALTKGRSNLVIEELAKIVACHSAEKAATILEALAADPPPSEFAWLVRRTEHHIGVPVMSTNGDWLRGSQVRPFGDQQRADGLG